MKDKNKKLMLIVSILVLGIGLTFAYFVVGVNILGTGGSTKLATSDLIRVKYDAGTNKLATSGLNPGHSTSKGFKVTVTPTKTVQEVTYRIYLNITSNTFEVCSDSNYNAIANDCLKDAEELIYILKDGNGNEIIRGDLTNGVTGEIELTRETKKIATETDYNYTIEIEFKDTGKDQNHNQSKTIIGEVKVEFAEPDTSDLNIMAVYVEKEDKPGKYDSVDQIPVNKSLNTEKSYCEVNGEKIEDIEFNYNYLTGKMGVNNFNSKGTKCYLYFDKNLVLETLAKLNVKNIKYGTPDFSQIATGTETEDNNGIYVTDDPMYGIGAKSYYWRGAATTNHMIFDNKCWRIVRINGDGSIRLIYNGAVQSGNTCKGNGSNSSSVVLSGTAYNSSYNNSSYVGWTYTISSQRPSSSNPQTSGDSALLKTTLESWYSSNISETSKNKVVVSNFCNDRNMNNNVSWIATGSNQNYATYSRLIDGNMIPTLYCSYGDIYQFNVGMITADEVQFAGASGGTTNNTKYYLYNGQYYWTMSPSRFYNGYARVFVVNRDNGFLGDSGTNDSTPKTRPVISLRSDVAFNEGSDGTQNNPYIVQ